MATNSPTPTILPAKIPSPNVPFVEQRNDAYILTQMAYLFLYNIFLNTPFNPRHSYQTESNTSGFNLAVSDVYSGSVETTLNLTGVLGAGANATLPTVANLVNSIQSPSPGMTFKWRVINTSGAAFSWTIATNTGWTRNGTMTIAQNTWRDFYITLNSLTTATLQSVGTGTS